MVIFYSNNRKYNTEEGVKTSDMWHFPIILLSEDRKEIMLKVEEKEAQQFSLFINKISGILLSTLMMLL